MLQKCFLCTTIKAMKRVSFFGNVDLLFEGGIVLSSIREVARLAKVSPATVSRVMNGTAAVAPETRERVLAAIEETGFIPNEVARSLFKKSAKTIGLIIPSIRNPYFTQLAGIIDELAGQEGYRIFLCNVGGDLEKEKAAIQMLVAMNADGVILASGNQEIQSFLSDCTIPVVALDMMVSTEAVEACVYCDYYQGGRLAMEHLLECGCQNIVCIRGPQELFSARQRYEGYRDVCRERGIPEQTVDCDYDFLSGLAMTEKLLECYPQVDGIIASNDIVAISIYKILHKKNITVPDRIQLIGFDGIDLSELMSPELTTVCQPIEDMAKTALDVVVRKKENFAKGTEYILPVTLAIRETTKRRGREQ